MSLLEESKKLPSCPGVYFFLNKKKEILYIGRAISLKKRVASYFRSFDPRITKLVTSSNEIKCKCTDSVLESLFLEANLIKKHWPKYNIKQRDYRSFLYIVVPKADYPRPFIVRERELQWFTPKAQIFGPYQSERLLKTALKIIRRIFPYSTCKPFSGKPCFDHQVGLCPGLCVGKISKNEYQKNIANLILLLKGQKKRLIKKLEKENPEKAKALTHIQDVALIAQEDTIHSFSRVIRIEGYDVSHLSGKESAGSMVVFINGEPAKSQYRLFKIKQAQEKNDLAALEEVLTRRFNHPEWGWPDLILIDGGRPQVARASRVLKNSLIKVPLIGISKFANDKLVFPAFSKDSFKKLAQSMKHTLIAVRDEAHRFALKYSQSQRHSRLKKK